MRVFFSLILIAVFSVIGSFVLGETCLTKAYTDDSNTMLLLHFNENKGDTAVDSSSNGNNGTLKEMADSDWVSGKFGNALDFDGTDDRVEVNADSTLNVNNTMTIELWLKPDLKAFTANERIIYKYDGADNWYQIAIDKDKFVVQANFKIGGKYYQDGTTNAISGNNWSHVTVTFNSGIIKIYINGVEDIGGDAGNLGATAGNTNLFIGSRVGNSCFHGLIDEVRISNKVRSLGEMITSENDKEK